MRAPEAVGLFRFAWPVWLTALWAFFAMVRAATRCLSCEHDGVADASLWKTSLTSNLPRFAVEAHKEGWYRW
jgi:hypothetical protein